MAITVGVVVFFNHRFVPNVPLLRRLYGKSCDRLLFLMPFYEGSDKDVVAVYETSYRFQNFFWQARREITDLKCDVLLFVADDVLLNPRFIHDQVVVGVGQGAAEGFIKNLYPLDLTSFHWYHKLPALRAIRGTQYVHAEDALPDAEGARALLSRHVSVAVRSPWACFLPERTDVFAREANLGERRGYRESVRRLVKRLRYPQLGPALRHLIRDWASRRERPFPLAMGFADVFVLRSARFEAFAELCGRFSALDLFAEVAIPTALALTCARLHTEKDTMKRGTELRTTADIRRMEEEWKRDLDVAIEGFPEDRLWVHPVKLSRWHWTKADA